MLALDVRCRSFDACCLFLMIGHAVSCDGAMFLLERCDDTTSLLRNAAHRTCDAASRMPDGLHDIQSSDHLLFNTLTLTP